MKKINKGKSLSRFQLVSTLSVLGAMGLAGNVHAAEAFAADSPWMTGDWNGKRTELLDKGYDFSLEYVSEMASNLKGGSNDDTTGRYSDQFALGMKVDLQKVLGWQDAEFKLAITERSG
ncbi:porin B, partial [Pseudomonas syringae pv. actinidiae ICMP 19096]